MKSADRQEKIELMATRLLARSISIHCARFTHSAATSLSWVSMLSRRERFAPQPAAAHRAAANREVDARIVKRRQDGLLDLIERHHAASDAMLNPLEGAGNLPDAAVRVFLRLSRDRIVIDHRLQHERVVGIEPEGETLFARRRIDRGLGERRHVPRRDARAPA